MDPIKAGELPGLFFCIIICQAAGILGSVFTSSSVSSWYQILTKPWFTPPGSVIFAAWLALFTLMGLSLFLVWREGIGRPDAKKAVCIFDRLRYMLAGGLAVRIAFI